MPPLNNLIPAEAVKHNSLNDPGARQCGIDNMEFIVSVCMSCPFLSSDVIAHRIEERSPIMPFMYSPPTKIRAHILNCAFKYYSMKLPPAV